MAKLKNAARPDGQSSDYRFFVDEEGGRTWKAKLEVREAGPQSFCYAVTVSPVDGEGKALRDRFERAIVGGHSRTITLEERRAAGFDPEDVLAEILHVAVAAQDADLVRIGDLEALGEKWKGGAALRLAKGAERAAAAIPKPPAV